MHMILRFKNKILRYKNFFGRMFLIRSTAKKNPKPLGRYLKRKFCNDFQVQSWATLFLLMKHSSPGLCRWL